MALTRVLPKILAFGAAAALALVTANYSVTLVEERSEIGVRDALDRRDLIWAEVEADGLQVTLAGTAPTEALRFQALSAAGSIVDAARVIDEMEVEAQARIAAPRFSAEILRNEAGISVIGLIPETEDRDALSELFQRVDSNAEFADFLETARYPVPPGWDDAIAFALSALNDLPRAKVSVEAGQVKITAITDSREDKERLERKLRRAAPPELRVSLEITAPRPVLTPFTLRFVSDEDGTRFDACSADSEASRHKIVQAAFAAGLTGPGLCTVGMGVPTPTWSEAVEMGITAVATLGGGSVTFSNADVALRALEGTDQALFDRVVGELENDLPDVFALTAFLPTPEDPSLGPPEFTATLSPEGLVQLRGRIRDEATRALATSYAQSLFGSDTVYSAPRLADNVPADWSVRVLTGLEALGQLSNGAVVVSPDNISISGKTGNQDANDKIARLLTTKLGEDQAFDINVTYQASADPVALVPSPEECEAEVSEIIAARKINFEPGSATIDASTLGVMDEIAGILKLCGDLKLEIQGHTDSQGREVMNLDLSQQRAQSVLNELRARRVLTSRFVAKGYGETQPIADNGTEEGREANRRIEFKLIRPAPTEPEPESTLDSIAEQATQGAAEPANDAEENQGE